MIEFENKSIVVFWYFKINPQFDNFLKKFGLTKKNLVFEGLKLTATKANIGVQVRCGRWAMPSSKPWPGHNKVAAIKKK